MAKNLNQSVLHKKYIELKRKIASAQYMLDYEKSHYWDMWCFNDERTFNKVKAQTIREMRLELKCMHKESKILKMKMVQANQAYQREMLLDKMNNICDKIIEKIDSRKENYSL